MINTYPKYLFTLFVAMLLSMAIRAQGVDSLMVYFRLNESVIDPAYKENAKAIETIQGLLDEQLVGFVTLTVSSSPDGPYSANASLAEKRAESIRALFGDKVSRERIIIEVIPENWEGIIEQVQESYTLRNRKKVLEILLDGSIDHDTREKRLKALSFGSAWRYITKMYLPNLRSASVMHILKVVPEQYMLPRVKSFDVEAYTASRTAIQFTPPKIGPPPVKKESSFAFAIRSNLLYDIALVPNIGIEFHLGKGVSLGFDYNHAWWSLPQKDYFWRLYGGGITLRKYFGKASSQRALSGHHLGLHAQAFVYDFELGGRGQLSDLTYVGGLEYGYSLPVSRSLNIDFSVGFGYAGGEYKVYEPEDDCYVWKETRQRHYYGPTKGEISLVWIIGPGKGGER